MRSFTILSYFIIFGLSFSIISASNKKIKRKNTNDNSNFSYEPEVSEKIEEVVDLTFTFARNFSVVASIMTNPVLSKYTLEHCTDIEKDKSVLNYFLSNIEGKCDFLLSNLKSKNPNIDMTIWENILEDIHLMSREIKYLNQNSITPAYPDEVVFKMIQVLDAFDSSSEKTRQSLYYLSIFVRNVETFQFLYGMITTYVDDCEGQYIIPFLKISEHCPLLIAYQSFIKYTFKKVSAQNVPSNLTTLYKIVFFGPNSPELIGSFINALDDKTLSRLLMDDFDFNTTARKLLLSHEDHLGLFISKISPKLVKVEKIKQIYDKFISCKEAIDIMKKLEVFGTDILTLDPNSDFDIILNESKKILGAFAILEAIDPEFTRKGYTALLNSLVMIGENREIIEQFKDVTFFNYMLKVSFIISVPKVIDLPMHCLDNCFVYYLDHIKCRENLPYEDRFYYFHEEDMLVNIFSGSHVIVTEFTFQLLERFCVLNSENSRQFFQSTIILVIVSKNGDQIIKATKLVMQFFDTRNIDLSLENLLMYLMKRLFNFFDERKISIEDMSAFLDFLRNNRYLSSTFSAVCNLRIESSLKTIRYQNLLPQYDHKVLEVKIK